MIIVISEQLGNQMFAYATAKTVAQKWGGYSFNVYLQKSKLINSTDKRIGNDITTIFPIIANERIYELPESYNIRNEKPLAERVQNYDPTLFEIEDHTILYGHYISVKYFENNLKNVRQWFQCDSEIEQSILKKFQDIKREENSDIYVSVHFRVGKDYCRQGYLMNYSYWDEAANKMLEKFGCNVKFLVFCDRVSSIVERFCRKFNARLVRGSLVEDMKMIGYCDAHIVCNSSFSIMSVLIGETDSHYVIRPSCYLSSGLQKYPCDCFLEKWDTAKAKRDLKAVFWGSIKEAKWLIKRMPRK